MGFLKLGLITAIVIVSLSVPTTKLLSKTANPVIAAAGDIACAPQKTASQKICQMQATADLLGKVKPVAVLPLGDNQYEKGSLEDYQKYYAPTWGKFKSITHPVVGNHEYYTPKAKGYFQYFGKSAGNPTQGYYSFDLGAWHLIALNGNCEQIGGCGVGSPQERWLKADLAKHKNKCSLAYWHQPRFSSGVHGNNESYTAFWQDLYKAGVEIVLNGHDHTYERFALQSPEGVANNKGVRQFVVGSGGRNHYAFKTIRANSQVRNNDTYGVLFLTLAPTSYQWEFMPVAGQTFTDSGTNSCF
jgi:hypothetical protein